MNITIIGRGNIGGALATKYRAAGHDVQALGREGGDASQSDVVVVAVPDVAIRDALSNVTGVAGKVTIDATNVYNPREAGFDSNTALIKAIIGGPTAKAFNANFAEGIVLNNEEPTPPGNFYVSDPEVSDIAEQLIREAGFEPIRLGDLGKARLLEDHAAFMIALIGGLGVPFYYRYSAPVGGTYTAAHTQLK